MQKVAESLKKKYPPGETGLIEDALQQVHFLVHGLKDWWAGRK